MNRRPNLLSSLATAPLLLVALAACGPGDEGADVGDTAPATDAAAPAATMPPPVEPEPMAPGEMAAPTQAEALALLIAVNEHEIAAAEQAREKQVDGEVLEYADMMHSDHTANLEASRELAGTATGAADDAADPAAGTGTDPGMDAGTESPMLADLRASGEATLERLSTLEGDEYEQAYVDAMVQDHQKALDMLDNQLIPAAQDEAVREHLTTTREKIAAHLEQAQTLQSGLQAR